jgi:hypothetical protein
MDKTGLWFWGLGLVPFIRQHDAWNLPRFGINIHFRASLLYMRS